ncbi:MAG: hypothetical protein JWN70_6895 [Planctomycetaceae bacterium]|nr:hypothetical protein [Planctomycetaceae bacterium]
MIGRGSLESFQRVIHFATSTSLLELDKLHDHVTHDVRHSKHFKKQRKPYLFIFIKKPRKSFDFEAAHDVAMTFNTLLMHSMMKRATCIWRGEIQGEMTLRRIA